MNVTFPDTVTIAVGNDADGNAIGHTLHVSEMSDVNVILAFIEGVGRMARDKTLKDDESTIAGRRTYIDTNVKLGKYQQGKRADTILKRLRLACVDMGKTQDAVKSWDREDIRAFFLVYDVDIDDEIDDIKKDIAKRARIMATVNVDEAINE